MERLFLTWMGILIFLYGNHAHSAELYSHYLLEWENTETEIELKMTVATLGYVGIGFSKNETMAKSDIIVAGISKGKAYVWDAHSGGNGELQVDEDQDATITRGFENGTHTIVTVTRPLFTDDSNDYQFKPGEMNVIWAFGQEDVALQLQISDFRGGSRGFRKLTLISDEDCTGPRSTMTPPPTTTSFIDGTTSLAHDHKLGRDSCDLPYQVFLDKDKKVDLKWDFENEDIVMQLTAPTVGWMGLGFSPKISMRGADLIMMGYRSDGAYAINCHATLNGVPKVDDKQDIEILSGYENATHTSVRIKRKLKPCNKQDRNIDLSRTLRALYAFAASDVIGNSPKNDNYHGMNRGGRSLILANPQKFAKAEGIRSDLKEWDATVQSASIPAQTTYYRCIMLELPTPETYYAKGYRPIVDEANAMNLHHILVYDCTNSKGWRGNGVSGQCYVEMSPFDNGCFKVIAGWALGSTGVVFPEKIALALPHRMMLEIHYDNQERREFVDNSGFRFFYTMEKPEIPMAILQIEESTGHIVVPPKSDNFLVAGYCKQECITKGMNEAGISEVTVYSSLLHSHTAGRSIRLRHFRDGKEMKPLSQDLNYDFDYQETRYLPNGTTIKSGDSFRIECVYETMERDKVTTGGLPTSSEMCMAFLNYYPAINLSSCFSPPKIIDRTDYFTFFHELGVIVGEQEFQTLKVKILDPKEHFMMEVLSPVLNRVDWTDEKKQTLRDFMETTERYPACFKNKEFIIEPVLFTPAKFNAYSQMDEDQCEEVGDAEDKQGAK